MCAYASCAYIPGWSAFILMPAHQGPAAATEQQRTVLLQHLADGGCVLDLFFWAMLDPKGFTMTELNLSSI